MKVMMVVVKVVMEMKVMMVVKVMAVVMSAATGHVWRCRGCVPIPILPYYLVMPEQRFSNGPNT